jgi:hypothetical protein
VKLAVVSSYLAVSASYACIVVPMSAVLTLRSAGYVQNTIDVPDKDMAVPPLLDSSMVSRDKVVPDAV